MYPVFCKKEKKRLKKKCVSWVFVLRRDKPGILQSYYSPSIHPSMVFSTSKSNKKMINYCNISLGPVCIHQDWTSNCPEMVKMRHVTTNHLMTALQFLLHTWRSIVLFLFHGALICTVFNEQHVWMKLKCALLQTTEGGHLNFYFSAIRSYFPPRLFLKIQSSLALSSSAPWLHSRLLGGSGFSRSAKATGSAPLIAALLPPAVESMGSVPSVRLDLLTALTS